MTNIRKALAAFAVVAVVSPFAVACDKAEPEAAAETALAKRPEKADPNDWCAPHDVPESMCTKCHKEKISLYQAAGDFCDEHGFPESVCPKCNPLEAPAGAAAGDDHADEHGH